MRILLTILVAAVSGAAQTITITSPAASQSITSAPGTTFALTCTLSSAPSTATVLWQVDGEQTGLSRQPPFTFNWSTFEVWNGSHKAVAIAQDALGNTVATSSAVTFTVNNSWPYNTGSTGLTTNYQTAFAVTPGIPETSNWSGTVTLQGTLGGAYNTGLAATAWTVWVDGQRVIWDVQNGNVTTRTESLDTTKYPNGPHQVTYMVTANDNFDNYAMWERTIIFANGATAMELRVVNSTASGRELFLCLTPGTNCPSTATLSGQIVKTDGSTAAATPSFTASASPSAFNQTAPCAVGASTGVVTVSAKGKCKITMTASGFTRVVWVTIFTSANRLPHFGADGSILTAYDPTKSIYLNSSFFSVPNPVDYSYRTGADFGRDYAAAGWNTLEPGCAWSVPASDQVGYQNAQTALVTANVNYAATYGLYLHPIGDCMMRDNPSVYNTTRGASASWSPTAVNYAFTSWKGKAIGFSMVDEVSSSWDHKPQGTIPQMGGANGPSSIVCVSGGNCTVNWTDWSLNGGTGFIIRGSVQGLNSTNPTVFIRNGGTANSFTFTNPGVGNLTANSSNDPNLIIEQYANEWQTGTDYIRWDAFQQFMTQANSVVNRPKITWPPPANASGAAFTNWEGDSRMSDFADCYYLSNDTAIYFQSSYGSSWALLSLFMDWNRDRCQSNYNLDAEPVLSLTQGTADDYGYYGIPVSVTSISNDVVTFSAPHNVSIVYPGVTRLGISGSSNSAYNTDFYVRSILSPTALQIYGFMSNTGSGFGGTATFADASTYTIGSLVMTAGSYNGGSFVPNTDPSCTLPKHRGQNVAISGNSFSAANATFYAVRQSQADCTAQTSGVNIMQIPSGSSTGGTASIISDNYLMKGRNQAQQTNGPRMMYATDFGAMVVGSSGKRTYSFGVDMQAFNPHTGRYQSAAENNATRFSDTRTDTVQVFLHPQVDFGNQKAAWHSHTNANLLSSRLARYLFQARLASPDYGTLLECTARTGSYGQMLMCQSFADGPQTRTFDLSPYLAGGQKIIRYVADWQGITTSTLSVGTTSDTVTMPWAGTVIYVFPVSFSSELSQPTLSVRLADVPNAAKVVVRFAYSPYLVDLLAPTVDCGNGSACVLPADKQIGPVYYRSLFLDTNSKVLAISDVQTL